MQQLKLYRRHSSECAKKLEALPARSRRNYLECDCQIWICGRTPDGRMVPRQSTGTTELKTAEATRNALIAEGKDRKIHGPRISECIDLHVDAKKSSIKDNTSYMLRWTLDQFKEYCAARQVFFMSDLTVDLIEKFKTYGMPGLEDSTKKSKVQTIRCFLKTAYRLGWTPQENLAAKVLPYYARNEQKSPYSDEEVVKIIAGAEMLPEELTGYLSAPHTFRLLLELMLETGMRVSDAIRYDPKKAVRSTHFWIYTFVPQKQKKATEVKLIDAYFPEALKAEIDSCTWMSKELPFMHGKARAKGSHIWKIMKRLGKIVDVDDCRPHRFRDTFAVRKLLAGIPVEDVSRLLGHSSVKVTEAYYLKWIPKRAARLEQMLAEARGRI